jgi:long-chain fatty acid transport protein
MLNPGSALSSNGYFPHAWGTKSGAMAGAGSAMSEDAAIIATNPAGILGLKNNELVLDLTFLKVWYEVETGSFELPQEPLPPGAFPLNPGRYVSDPPVKGDIFAIPGTALAWRLNERASIGIASYANGGLNVTLPSFDNPTCPPGTPQKGLYCFGGASTDLQQVFIAPTFAYQIGDWLRLGVSPILAIESIEVNGLRGFADLSSSPDRLSNNGHQEEFGYGGKFGIQARLSPTVQLAAVAQTRVDVARFKQYEGLFVDKGNFDIPPYYTAGIAWDVTPKWTAAFDVQYIRYSDIKALGNKITESGPLGSSNGPGFGLEEATAYKFGLRYQHSPKWTWRFGYSENQHAVDKSQLFFTLLAASVPDEHYAFGFSYRPDSRNEFDMAFTYNPERRIRGPNAFFPDQDITARIEVVFLAFAWRWSLSPR